MPKKTGNNKKKPKPEEESKSGDSNDNSNAGKIAAVEERYSSFVQLPETKTKSQIKRQKRKDRKSKLELEKNESDDQKKADVEEVSEEQNVDTAEDEEKLVMNAEEEDTLRDFLRTLEMADSRVREQKELVAKLTKKAEGDYEVIEFKRGVKVVEPIPEEALEELVQQKDDATAKVLYSYNGIPFSEQDKKQSIVVQDIDDGILLINNIRCKEPDRYPYRSLDVILEESSDISDASSIKSDLKNDSSILYKTVRDKTERIFDGRGKTFDLQIQPVIKETVQIIPLEKKPDLKTDSTQVRIETVVVEKVHPTSIVKIELSESESGSSKQEDEKESLSANHLLVDSSEIKFIDEDSSWSSGGLYNAEDGAEGDVESELDSRRETFLLENETPVVLDDIFDSTDFGTIKKSPFKKQQLDEHVLKNVKTSPTFSGRDSASSGVSGGTVKNVTSNSRDASDEDTDVKCEDTFGNSEINLGYVSSDPSLLDDYLHEPVYKDHRIAVQVEEVRKGVSVKKLAKELEPDISKILKSKLKVIEFFEDPIMSEASWSSILENTKPDRKSLVEDDGSHFSLVKFKHNSNSSSYENVSKSLDSILEQENIYEVIQNPEALSNLAEKKVMSLPYGQFLLRKIGLGKCCEDAAKEPEDDIYTKIDGKVPGAAVGSQHLMRSQSASSTDGKSRCLPCGSKKKPGPYIEFNYGKSEKWYGMPTSHPSLLLGLSPSQKKIYEESHKKFLSNEEEAANLLDLHKKFLERRSYHEENPFKRNRTVVYSSKEPIYAEIAPLNEGVADATGAVEDGYAKVEKKKSKPIGSCGLLAIIQNATSDDFVPKLNDKASGESGSEDTWPKPRLKNEDVVKERHRMGNVRSPVIAKKPGLTEEEEFKQRMFEEYMRKVAERRERRQQKLIKMSQKNEFDGPEEVKVLGIECEFINKVRERMEKLGMKQEEEGGSDMECREFEELFGAELKEAEEAVKAKRGSGELLLDASSDLAGMPKHLQEFLQAWEDEKMAEEQDGVWSPAHTASEDKTEVKEESEERKKLEDEPIPPVWTPKSAQASPVLERREFRPVNFESPTLPRKKYIQEKERSESVPPPWQQPGGERLVELVKTPSSPSLSLPKAPNPTVTLLQKAREGHLPRGAHYLNHNMSESLTDDGTVLQTHEKFYTSAKEDSDRPRKVDIAPKKIIGIGPTTKEGIPLVLRSEVTDENKEKWYKRMYDSLHKAGKDEDFVTVKYRTSPSRKGLYGYQPISSSGYQSEPESLIYDSSRLNKYTTLDRRRADQSKDSDYISITLPRSRASTPRYGAETYKNQPGRIEDYEPGHSSISELEARQWWDEVLEIFDRWLERNPGCPDQDSSKLLTDAIERRRQEERGQPIHKAQSPKSFMTYALKDSAFIADPQHVFKRREDEYQSPLSPQEQKEAYRVIQKGGEVPLRGLRKPAPERPKDDKPAQIEYFPLSPTLTRIRVHKQNITPLNPLPFLQFPIPYQANSLAVPFGVCNSFSQVQIFPSVINHSIENKSNDNPENQNRKFDVQLQNISESKVVPKPRNAPKKSPIYVNLPVRPETIQEESPVSLSSEGSGKKEDPKTGPKTFSDLKRIAPSIVSKTLSRDSVKKSRFKSQIPISKTTRKIPLSERNQKPVSGKSSRSNSPKKEEMNPVYDSANPNFGYKHRVESNVTEAFRSRSFSPDVRRKTVPKPDPVVPPMPPKRKQSKSSSTLRMWSKMMVTYPNHRSRFDVYDSNVKFLREKLRRKLDHEDKENENQFGDDVETVRTVKKSKDGSMSIKTNRYVNIRPVSSSPVRYTYNEHGRRVLSEPRAFAEDKPDVETKKKSDTLVRSSTTYSVRRPVAQDEKGKSVKVTVAVSSKGKEFLRKTASVARKPPTKGTASPCPSISSYRSGLSGKESSTSSRVLSPTSSTGRPSSPSRSASPASVKHRTTPPLTITFAETRPKKLTPRKTSEKTPAKLKTETKRKIKKPETEKKPKKNGNGKIATKKKDPKSLPKSEVEEHTNLVRTNSFFQNLFLRGPPDKRPLVRLDRTSSVLERAKRYQSIVDVPPDPKPEPSLSLVTYYLSQKKPVSLSKFRYLDREVRASRSPSPYLYRSPSFQMKLRHFDSLSQFGDDDFGSGLLSLKERSLSEPPVNRSETSSPEERMGIKPASRLSVSETSSLRTSPTSSRSPSCRRIQTYKPEVKRKAPRARSAGEVEGEKPKTIVGSLAQSTSSLNLSNFSDHAEYQAYVLELMHSKEKCQRFRDLHKFYSSLERMGELERTASVGDLRPRLRNEEIIDFDRWKQLRTKERAEAELKSLVGKLMKVQKEKDLLFRTADVNAVRWKGDRGLRIKERSVDDLKEQFDKNVDEVAEVDNFKKCIEAGKDVYKPFWRGNSIVNLATTLNATTASHRGRPVTYDELQRIKAAEERLAKKFGLKSFSNRAWSSLSTAQVDALKNQLSEIYSQELKKKGVDLQNYEITVPDDVRTPGEKGLYVRCNSVLTKDQLYGKKEEGKKSGSISALPSWEEKKSLLELPWKEEEKKASKPLSESEKKRLSMTLSKEVLEKLKTPVKTHLLPRETLGALVVASNAIREAPHSPRTCYSLETSEDGKSKNDFLLVLTPTEKGREMERVVEEWANQKPVRTASVTELESASASSETSVKTVIRNPVLKKVEYYEELQQNAEESMAAEALNRGNEIRIDEERPRFRGSLAPSRSMENLKEYFGEKYPARMIEPTGHRSSNDSLFSMRSRSVSPDPTKYYRAYLRMVKCGAVRKLRNKFESWEDLLTLTSDKDPWLPPKRYASDPELTRDLLRRYGTDPTKVTVRGQEVGDVRWLRTKYENDNPRGRRFRSPVPRNPFSVSDRFMPRINVISKTAELQMNRRRSPDGRQSMVSPEPYRSLSEYTRDHGGYYYTGEVEKLRRKFEKLHAAERLSILGQMYTSTPDVSELRDIAPYLGCSWVAHRHPELTKTSSSPDLRLRRPEPSKKVKPRPHSSSPVRARQPSSILKSTSRDVFADQKFDPSIHRPVCRYQPEVEDRSKRGTTGYPHWRQWKPSVKFKETVSYAQESKPLDSSPDSSRKYVESEVTIHYKSPVRSEAKAVLSEDELARRQAESMKRIYKEERRRKYLQELQDMNSRRHADNFTPSQKSPIPLNRYDDFPDEPPSFVVRGRDHATEPVLVARGLYDFVGRRPRELAFRRGDIIFMIRQLDKNWCEGELNGCVGLFPLSYVEFIPYSEYNPKFGRARAKYDFVPQTSLELSARKGDMITLVRKIDENWFEGRIGDRSGIIPASYCQVLSMPQIRVPARSERAASSKPVAAPAAHSLIHNGGAVSAKHSYNPYYGGRNSPGRSTTSPAVREAHAAIDQLIDEALFHLEEDIDRRSSSKSATQPLNLRVNPRPEPALYQVLFNHVPNNDDELELIQGETVLVLEKCGDGWYIGSKTSGGKLGIFPGTHVRRIAPEFV